jgi:hypothetical protein
MLNGRFRGRVLPVGALSWSKTTPTTRHTCPQNCRCRMIRSVVALHLCDEVLLQPSLTDTTALADLVHGAARLGWSKLQPGECEP